MPTKIFKIPAEIATAHNGWHFYGNSSQFDHRGLILRFVCDIEYEFKLYLFTALRKINFTFSEAELEKGMFVEPNSLSSLSKCLKFAAPLGLVSKNEFHDLDLMVKLRNMYAHGRERQQLDQDPKAMAVVKNLKLY